MFTGVNDWNQNCTCVMKTDRYTDTANPISPPDALSTSYKHVPAGFPTKENGSHFNMMMPLTLTFYLFIYSRIHSPFN